MNSCRGDDDDDEESLRLSSARGKALTFSFFSSDFFVFFSFTEPDSCESDRRLCPLYPHSGADPGQSRPHAALSGPGSAGSCSVFHLGESAVALKCSRRGVERLCESCGRLNAACLQRVCESGRTEATRFMSL